MTTAKEGIKRTQAGFTLVEAIIALAVSLILGVSFYFLYNHQQKQYLAEKSATELQENTRFILDTMGRDLIMAGYRPADGNGISEGSPNKLIIQYWDDKATTPAPYDKHYRITYRVASDVDATHVPLVREVQRYNPSAPLGSRWSAAQVYRVGEYVESLEFRYFDKYNALIAPGTTDTELEKVRNIEVKVRVRSYDKDPISQETDKYRRITLSRTFQARNLGIMGNPVDITPPSPPTGLVSIDPGICGELQVRWNPNTEADLDGYYLYLGQETGIYVHRVRLSKGTTTYTFTGLTSTTMTDVAAGTPTTYFIAVSAFDRSANNSPLSAEVSGNPSPNVSNFSDVATRGNDTTINPQVSAPPTSFEARKGPVEGSINLSWLPNPSPDVVAYRLYRSDNISFAPSGEHAGEGTCVAVLDRSATTYADSGLIGCLTYYYKIASVNCDPTLVSTYGPSDFATCYGDGALTTIAADYPTAGVTDTTPADATPIDNYREPGHVYDPVPALSSLPGWKRVFLSLKNPNRTDDPDFAYTNVFWSKTGYPAFLPSSCAVDPSTGSLVPDRGGIFTAPGNAPENNFKHDSETEAEPVEPSLQDLATYYYLAVAYDQCGNCTSATGEATTLSELCGDDPPGLPQCSPPITLAADAEGCTGSVYLSWNGDCLKEGTIGLNQDFAGFHVFRNEGATYDPGAASHVELTHGIPQWYQSFTDATVAEGRLYSYAVEWADCAYEHANGGAISNPFVNGGIANGVAMGRIREDLNKIVLSGDLTVSPPIYTHGKVTFYIRNTAAVPLIINSLSLRWLNSLAFLQKVVVGDGNTTTRQTVWEDTSASLSIGSTGGTISIGKSIDGLDTNVPVELYFAKQNGVVDYNADMREERIDLSVSYTNFSTGTSTCAETGTLSVPTGPVVYRVVQDRPVLPTDAWAVPGYSGTNLKDQVVTPGGSKVVVYANVRFPDQLTSILSATITSTANTIAVSDTSGFPSSGTIFIGSERITYTGLTATSFLGCTRGTGGTTAALHFIGATVFLISGSERMTLYYYVDASKTLAAAPVNTGYNYTPLEMRRVSGELWKLYDVDPVDYSDHRIPMNDNASVWYYLVAIDSQGNFDRDPEMEAGAYQYLQLQGDVCANTPRPPSLSGQVVGSDVVLSWAAPTMNTNSTVCTDLAGFRVYRYDGYVWSLLKEIPNPFTLTYSDKNPPSISTKRYAYYVTAYDLCTPTPRESVGSNIFTECVGESPCVLTLNRVEAHPGGAFRPGDSFGISLQVCGSTAPYLYVQDCTLVGGDADPIRMSNDGYGNFSIDSTFYGGRDKVLTYLQSAYPPVATNLDLWLANSGSDTIMVHGAFTDPPSDSACQATASCQQTISTTPPGPAVINLSTASLAAAVSVGTDALGQAFSVWNTGDSTLTYTIAVDQPWLSVAPSSGSSSGLPNTHAVTFSTAGLAVGTYLATITVADPAASNSPQAIAVSLTVAALPPPVISLSTGVLTNAALRGDNAPAQSFEVWNSGVGILNFTVATSQAWLSVNPAGGSSVGSTDRKIITLSYNTAALTAGIYTAVITVSDPAAVNSPQLITVNVTVSNRPPATIGLSVATLSPSCMAGTNAASQTFQVWNSGVSNSEPLSFTVSRNQTWLTVTPASGTSNGPTDRKTLTVTYSTAGMPAGSYTATITVSDPIATNNPQTVTVNLTVNADPCTNPLAPGAPTGMTAAAANGNCNGYVANLSWTAPAPAAGNGPVGYYDVYECAGAGCTPATKINASPVTGTHFTRTTALKLKNEVYRWAVKAVNNQCSTNVKASVLSNITDDSCLP